MIKTEVCLSYQKPQGEQPCVVLTMEDFLIDGRVLTHVDKITKEAPDQYHVEVTQDGYQLANCRMERKELMHKYGGYISARIIGHL